MLIALDHLQCVTPCWASNPENIGSRMGFELVLGVDQVDMERNQDISEKRESYRGMKELLSWQGRRGTWVIILPEIRELHPVVG